MSELLIIMTSAGAVIGILLSYIAVLKARIIWSEMICRNANSHAKELKDAIQKGWSVYYDASSNSLNDGYRSVPLETE